MCTLTNCNKIPEKKTKKKHQKEFDELVNVLYKFLNFYIVRR